jgi:hypothetical protein
MSKSVSEFLGALVVAAGVTGLLMLFMHAGTVEGKSLKEKAIQREAVLSGHAEYVADENGSPKWQWKALSPESK